MAARIRAGTVWVNAYRVVAPSVPFGGYGASGLGRENGIDVINEYTEKNPSGSSSPAAPETPSPSADQATGTSFLVWSGFLGHPVAGVFGRLLPVVLLAPMLVRPHVNRVPPGASTSFG